VLNRAFLFLALLTTLLAGLVLPALLLATLAGFVLPTLLTTLVLLAGGTFCSSVSFDTGSSAMGQKRKACARLIASPEDQDKASYRLKQVHWKGAGA
jgi:uncharacterized membrane protein YdjX (TVP38/TMEM64 family)